MNVSTEALLALGAPRRLDEVERVSTRFAGTVRHLVETAMRVREVEALQGAQRRAASALALRNAAREILATLGFEVEIVGRLPVGQALMVANHLSWVDPLLVVQAVPAVALAKREVFDWPVIGAQVRKLGVVMVDRRDAVTRAGALRRAWRALAEGSSVLNFPEGTTTYGDTLPFHRGLFAAAIAHQVPVVPIRIEYDDRDACWVGDETFLPHFLRLARRRVTRARLSFGTPLVPRKGEEAQDLADRARARITFAS